MRTVVWMGGHMENDFQEQVMLEQVELIARLAAEGAKRERDREIALNLIVELFRPHSEVNKVLCGLRESLFSE